MGQINKQANEQDNTTATAMKTAEERLNCIRFLKGSWEYGVSRLVNGTKMWDFRYASKQTNNWAEESKLIWSFRDASDPVGALATTFSQTWRFFRL